ncbi:MAG: hypothetical protein ACKVZJ_01935 [Phycisphaerales bacterium]
MSNLDFPHAEPAWLLSPPSPETFLWAGRRGLGRAVWWLKRFDPTLYVPAIAELSTTWMGYDYQVDDNHAAYLIELAELSGRADEIAAATFDAALRNASRVDACHVDDLMDEWVRRGRAGAREAVERGFEAEITKGRTIGGNAIIALEGVAGLVRIARRVGASLSSHEGYDPFGWINNANVTDDVEDAEERLRKLADTDEQIAAFLRTVDAERVASTQHNAEYAAERARRVSLEDIVAAVQDPALTLYQRGRLAWRWWDWASDGEWSDGAKLFVESEDSALVWALQRAFKAGSHGTKFRPFPLPISGLVARSMHADERIRKASRYVLAVQSGQEVVAAGRALLDDGDFKDDVIRMLSDAFQPEDVGRVLRAVGGIPLEDAEELHSVGLDVKSVCESTKRLVVQPLLRWLYEHTPCAFCRSNAVEEMLALGTMPPDVAFEAAFDSSVRTRRLIAGEPPDADETD